MKILTRMLLAVLVAGCALSPAAHSGSAEDGVLRISAAEAHRLYTEGAVLFVDARAPASWNESDVKLPGALRVTGDADVQHLREAVAPEGTIVAYCT